MLPSTMQLCVQSWGLIWVLGVIQCISCFQPFPLSSRSVKAVKEPAAKSKGASKAKRQPKAESEKEVEGEEQPEAVEEPPKRKKRKS